MAYIDRETFKPFSDISVSKVEQRSFDCDDLIAPVISILNKKGYKTNFCCAGHPYPLYEEMYVLQYEDTYEAISSTWGSFIPDERFFFENALCKKISLEEIPEGYQFLEGEIDLTRPHSVYYLETDDKIFGTIAYISFKGKYFTEASLPAGWELIEAEYYDPDKDDFNNEESNDIIEFTFPQDQDVYDFFMQQVEVFKELYNWAKELPDISESKWWEGRLSLGKTNGSFLY